MIISNRSNTDFTILALQNNIKLEKIYRESVMDIMSLESDFIENCLEMGQIVTEAMDATEVEVTKKRGIFDRIMDAIQALFGTFKEKITILMDKNNQWLKANLVNITKESMSKLGEVELVPYWTSDANIIGNSLLDVSNNLVNRTKASPEKFASMEELTKIVRQKIGGDSDLATDAKNFFRTGKPGTVAKPIKINGGELATHLDEMYGYVVQYDKIVIPRVNKYMSRIKSTVNSLKSSAKLESFCFLENAMYNDTEIGLLPNFAVVLEANNETKDTQVTNGKIDDNKQNQSMTKVTVSKPSEEETEQQKENSAKITEYCKNLTNILKILQGAALTVLEEKYITYINLFKAVVDNEKASKAKSKESSNEEDTTDEGATKEEPKENTKEPKKPKKQKKGLFGKIKN